MDFGSASRGIELSVELGREPIGVDADPARLQQMLVNLLDNVAKYTAVPAGRSPDSDRARVMRSRVVRTAPFWLAFPARPAKQK